MRQLFQNSIGDGVTVISNATQRAMLYWAIAIRASLTLSREFPLPLLTSHGVHSFNSLQRTLCFDVAFFNAN